MRLLYLTGWCRSGSTLIGNLLNELPGVLHVGELHYLWRNGVLAAGTNSTCGCGEPIGDCPLWSAVLGKAGGDAAAAVADQRAVLRTRHAYRRLTERAPSARVARTRERMTGLYEAIAAESGASLIVDSSKYPAEPALLARAPDVDLRVLHVVRDPRATAHSWRRAKAYIPAMGVARSTAYWTGFGWASDRLHRGPVRVADGEAWRRELPRRDRAVATLLAAPLLGRYGYR